MNKPLLHLLRHKPDDPSAQRALVSALMPFTRHRSGPEWVVCAHDTLDHRPPEILLEAKRRVPALESLDLRFGLAGRRLEADRIGLLVFTGPAPLPFSVFGEAVNNGIPILAPDTWEGVLLRDGVTGFLYRDESPESLALSLITLAQLPHSNWKSVVRRACKEWLSHADDPLPERLEYSNAGEPR